MFRTVVVGGFRTPTDQVSRIRTVAGGFGLAAGSVCTVGEVCAHFLIVLTFVQPDRAAIGNIHIKARFTVFPLFQHFGLIGVKVKTGRVIGVIISSGCEVVGARYALEFVIAGIFFDGQSVFRKEQVYRFLCCIIATAASHVSILEVGKLRTYPVGIVVQISQLHKNQFINSFPGCGEKLARSPARSIRVQFSIRIDLGQLVSLSGCEGHKPFICIACLSPFGVIFGLREKLFAVFILD